MQLSISLYTRSLFQVKEGKKLNLFSTLLFSLSALSDKDSALIHQGLHSYNIAKPYAEDLIIQMLHLQTFQTAPNHLAPFFIDIVPLKLHTLAISSF